MRLLYCNECKEAKQVVFGSNFCSCGRSYAYQNKSGHLTVNRGYVIKLVEHGLNEACRMQRTQGNRKDGKGWGIPAFIEPLKDGGNHEED